MLNIGFWYILGRWFFKFAIILFCHWNTYKFFVEGCKIKNNSDVSAKLSGFVNYRGEFKNYRGRSMATLRLNIKKKTMTTIDLSMTGILSQTKYTDLTVRKIRKWDKLA